MMIPNSSPKIWFAGTHDIAAIILEKLLAFYPVSQVLTAPDKPQGRGKKLQPSPVKLIAEAHKLPIQQPPKLDSQAAAAFINGNINPPDLWIVIAYGALIPTSLLNWPKRGCINAHVSLLPRWRGASPVIQTLLAGDSEAGVTLMQMDEGWDTGPVLKQRAVTLQENETTATLSKTLALIGADLLIETLPQILDGTAIAIAQDNSQATHAPKLTKQDGLIDWTHSAQQISRAIRAYTPWPSAYSFLANHRVKITHARINMETHSRSKDAGTILSVTKSHLSVQTGDGILEIMELQFDGGKPQPIHALLNGNKKELLAPQQRFHAEITSQS